MEHFKRHNIVWKIFYWPVYLWFRLSINYRPAVHPVKGPALIVSNHVTDWDPMLLGLTVKNQTYFVASEHIFRKPFIAKLLFWLQSPIARIKGDTGGDTALAAVRRLRRGRSVAVFAEGNRTFNGLTRDIVESTAKLARVSGASLVTHRFRGGYLTSPRWAGASARRGRMTGEVVGTYPPETLKKMKPAEIADLIRADIFEDAYATQREWNIPYKGRRLAEHLERALCLCPSCGGMGTLYSRNDTLSCAGCGLTAVYSPYGYLEGNALPFRAVTEWDEWQTGELARLAGEAGDECLASDNAMQLLSVAAEDFAETSLGVGELRFFRDRLECAGRIFPLASISGMNMNGPQMLVFTTEGGEHYTVVSSEVRNVRKYISLFYAVTAHEKLGAI